ncbi:MAG: nicotinamide-nucleotide amidohydrolase family protein, partial [Elusimicrobia bacterium]|nr:nicotinamide-nucleotide amidohydrolase family protein [Elusimicrobiota bacterium]
LKGKSNTDSVYLGMQMDLLGEDCVFYTVSDNEEEIIKILEFAFENSDFVITVGGCGPTFDDKTVDAIAKFTNRKRVLDRKTLENIADYYLRQNIDFPKIAERQAYVIEGAKIFQNRVGTAPAQIVNFRKKDIIILPAPPLELKTFFEKDIRKYIEKKFSKIFTRRKSLRIIGLKEIEVQEKISPVLSIEKFSGEEIEISILPHIEIIDLDIRIKGANELELDERIMLLKDEFYKVLGDHIFGEDAETLELVCGKLLLKKRKTLSVAESCTGGEISNLITNVQGASSFFTLGAVAYTAEEKCKVLGLKIEEIKKAGVVSPETAVKMAQGVLNLSGSDYAISTTGVAGPDKLEGKKVGTVFIGFCERGGRSFAKEFTFEGTRNIIKKRASLRALNLLREELLR